MHVAVEQPGQHGRAGAVDGLVAIEIRADVEQACHRCWTHLSQRLRRRPSRR